MLSRRTFLWSSAGLLTGAVAAGIYTRFYEPTWLEITYRPMPIRNLPPELVGKTLVQFTDIHVSDYVLDSYVLEVFNRIRALTPDIVVYTGDFTSYHDKRYRHAELVYAQMVKGTLGTFASLGNHDYGIEWKYQKDADSICAVLRNMGCTPLVNEVANVSGLQIVGLGDLWAGTFRPDVAFAQAAPDAPMIALSHNPDTVDLNGWAPFSGWILAGHTHGGQCKPPFLPPPVLPVKNKRYSSGTFDLPNARQMYIGRGVGTYLPVRFNVRPEVTVFTLSNAEA